MAALGLVVPMVYVLWRKGLLRPLMAGWFISVIVYVLVVYVGEITGGTRHPYPVWVGA